jgi:superfamily II DNA or RNA helicase
VEVVRAVIARAVAPPESAATLGAVRLFPHQQEAVALLRRTLARFHGALLADAVGLGKTFTALGVARCYGDVLVIHPACLREMWKSALQRAGITAATVSYERLSAGHEPDRERFDFVVLDEAHHARNHRTRRYRSIASLTWGADVLLLSATPLHNRRSDLRALFRLFLADVTLNDALLSRLVVRRSRHHDVSLPTVTHGRRLAVDPAPEVLASILALPPPVHHTATDAASLIQLSLVRQWCSSDAALAAALRRRRILTAAAEESASRGVLPDASALRALIVDDDTLQLDLFGSAGTPLSDSNDLLHDLQRHMDAVRTLQHTLARNPRDKQRFSLLSRALTEERIRRAIVFTHSARTASAAFRALRAAHRLACLTGRGALIASGPVSRWSVLDAFRPSAAVARHSDLARIDALIATDVLCEGVDLHDASLLIHLDLPWTASRLEQRVGRLRRLGSPHGRILVRVFVPPVDGDRIVRVVEALLQKARLSDRLVGSDDALAFRMLGARPRHADAPADLGLALRRRARAWLAAHGDTGPSATASPQPSVAACRGPRSGTFLAVISDSVGEEILVGHARGVTTAPTAIGAAFDALSGGGMAVDARRIETALTCLDRHFRHLAIVAGDDRGTSDTQRTTLRALERTLCRRGRVDRMADLRIVSGARDLVRDARGAGADFAMAEWLRGLETRRPNVEAVTRLGRMLSARHRPGPSPTRRLAALLIAGG